MPKHLNLPKAARTILELSPFDSDDDSPKWSQIARAGTFKGYAGGTEEFTFDLELFSTIVENFRKHPSYKKGSNGVGCSDVVAWDFHHASEMGPTSGTIPSEGAPAQGWVQEVDVRQNESGEIQLWALTRWLDKARGYVKDGAYKWASVSVVFEAIDPVTGENVGPMMTSVALTNQPFIEGMLPLVASKNSVQQKTSITSLVSASDLKTLSSYFGGNYFEAASSPEDAMVQIRRMLSLPETASAIDVVAELSKISQWISTGIIPMGVDLEGIVGTLRTIFNLAALSSPQEVMFETDRLIESLSQSTQPAEPQAESENLMLEKVAEILGIQPNEQAVLDVISALADLRKVVASRHGLDSTAAVKIVCEAVSSDSDTRAKYGPILEALGVEDPDKALDKIGGLMEQAAKLSEVEPAFTALKARQEEIDKAEEESDVDAAMASMNISEDSEHFAGIRLSVAHYRKSHDRKVFLERYPGADPKKAHLTKSISTTTTETPRTVAASRNEPEKKAIDITHFPGVNLQLKAAAYVKQTMAGADSWKHGKVMETASSLVRGGAVTMGK